MTANVQGTLGSGGYFFLTISMVRGEAPREYSISESLSNRKHGLFHIRYFENRPLKSGCMQDLSQHFILYPVFAKIIFGHRVHTCFVNKGEGWFGDRRGAENARSLM